MNLVWKLLRQHISIPQFAGFAFANLFGMLIVLFGFQFYQDVLPVFTQQDSFMKADYLIMSKKIGMGNTISGRSNTFSGAEMDDVSDQKFVKKIGKFTSTEYKVDAQMGVNGVNVLNSELFFESVPDGFVDVPLKDWKYTPGEKVVPIILPRTYINMYNFGFAQSHSLPKISDGLMGMIDFNICIQAGGKKELFKGLAIEQMEKEWTAYPVIHLDLSCGKYYSLENTYSILNGILEIEEKKYGLKVNPIDEKSFGARLKNILLAATAQTGKQVVVLIDEYDAPMHDSVSDEDLQKTIRNIMRDFFSPLKQQEGNIRFVFITGISKFSQLSIFSELNNLKILTLKDEYSSCCGITKSELSQYFREGIEEMAEHNGLTYEETLEQLKLHYDGYHFSINSEDIFNPYSIINALDDKEFNSYWFTSGTPTFLVELLQQKNLDMLNLDDLWIQASRFDTPTEKLADPIPVLFQSGYLTIKGYEKKGKLYHLCFPNQEVRQGFSESLVRYYSAQDMNRYDAIVYAYSKNVLINDDMEAFMPHLKAFYDKFPYTIINNNERHYQAVIFTIFTMLGEDVKVEHTTSDGRIDLVLKTDKSIFIFELKYKKSADIAMAQISDKDYAKAFADDGRKVVKVGINFSENQRSIEDWVIE